MSIKVYVDYELRFSLLICEDGYTEGPYKMWTSSS